MEKKVKIELEKGVQKFLADMTKDDLLNVKLSIREEGKHKGKTNITLKSEIISETPTHKIERRLYKWATMDNVAMYDLSIPKDIDIFIKEKGKQVVYEYAIGNFAIEQDKVNNGMTTGASKEAKAIGKAVTSASPEVQAEIQAVLAKHNVAPAKFEEMKKNMKTHGIGK